MRRIVIKCELSGYTDLESEIEKWLKEKVETKKVQVVRTFEIPTVMHLTIRDIPDNQRIDPEDFQKLLNKLNGSHTSLEDALRQTLEQMLKDARKLPDDGLPF